MRTLHLPIADPCHEDWEAMDANTQGRFCGNCTKQVHDLSTMSEPEARSLLRERSGGRICVRYEHDDDGRIRFRSPANLARAAVAGVALAACTPHDHPSTQVQSTQSMDVVVAPPAVPVTPTQLGSVEPEPVKIVKGEIAPEPPMEIHVRKGDIAVPNEPCDPEPVAEPVRPVRPRMGKPVLHHDDL